MFVLCLTCSTVVVANSTGRLGYCRLPAVWQWFLCRPVPLGVPSGYVVVKCFSTATGVGSPAVWQRQLLMTCSSGCLTAVPSITSRYLALSGRMVAATTWVGSAAFVSTVTSQARRPRKVTRIAKHVRMHQRIAVPNDCTWRVYVCIKWPWAAAATADAAVHNHAVIYRHDGTGTKARRQARRNIRRRCG